MIKLITLLNEIKVNDPTFKPKIKSDGDGYYQLIFPEGAIVGFLDKESKYRLKNYPTNHTVIFDNIVENNEEYNFVIEILNKYRIPYKLRKSRTDNMVRFMIDITKFLKINEIKVNNPNITPEKVIKYINSNVDIFGKEKNYEYWVLLRKFGFQTSTGRDTFIESLPQSKLNQLYQELQKLVNTIDEIKVNNPNKIKLEKNLEGIDRDYKIKINGNLHNLRYYPNMGSFHIFYNEEVENFLEGKNIDYKLIGHGVGRFSIPEKYFEFNQISEIKVNNPLPPIEQLKQFLKQQDIKFEIPKYIKNPTVFIKKGDLTIEYDPKRKSFDVHNPACTIGWNLSLEDVKEQFT